MITLDQAADLLHLFERRYRGAKILACDVRELGSLACGARCVWGRFRIALEPQRGVLTIGSGLLWRDLPTHEAAAAVAVGRVRKTWSDKILAMSVDHASGDANRIFLWEWNDSWVACREDAALASQMLR